MLSHEFVIQNHADMVSCLAMVILLGLMFEVPFNPVSRLGRLGDGMLQMSVIGERGAGLSVTWDVLVRLSM